MNGLKSLFARRGSGPVTTLVMEATDLRFLTAQGGRVGIWGSFPLPRGLVSQGQVTRVSEMGQIIGDLFAAEGLGRERVVTSVSGLRSISRVLTMPGLPASQLKQAVSREARREMPVSIEGLYLSWQVLSQTGNRQRVYLLGVPRELIDAQVQALQVAEVPVQGMDLKPLALVRAVNQREAIIANLEQDELGISVVADYLPALMRTFSLESEDLDVRGKIDRMVIELQQTVSFHNDTRSGLPMEPDAPVYVTGRALDDRDAFGYLASALDRPVERASLPIRCPEELPLGEYAANIGLALKKA